MGLRFLRLFHCSTGEILGGDLCKKLKRQRQSSKLSKAVVVTDVLVCVAFSGFFCFTSLNSIVLQVSIQ